MGGQVHWMELSLIVALAICAKIGSLRIRIRRLWDVKNRQKKVAVLLVRGAL